MNELSSSWFFSFIQSIVNNMPNLPSDYINEIVEVDFPTELAVSIFYQLLNQMTLLGSTIFHKYIIIHLLSFNIIYHILQIYLYFHIQPIIVYTYKLSRFIIYLPQTSKSILITILYNFN